MMQAITETTIEHMLETLVKLYIKDQIYPITFMGFWDIPQPQYALRIESKQELLGRIKQLGQLVNADSIIIHLENNSEVEFKI